MLKRCVKCGMANTRPRLEFDSDGVCGACRHWERKDKIDWENRKQELMKICDKFRSDGTKYDCVIPVSGGKDSSYVAWKMKHEFNMHPLCVTFASNGPSTEIGLKNLNNFIKSGFDHILISPNEEIRREFVKRTTEGFGDPFLVFVYGQYAAPLRIAVNYDIPLVVYGEDGEAEYGGTRDYSNSATFDEKFMTKYLLTGQQLEKWTDGKIKIDDLRPYIIPTDKEMKNHNIYLTHYSYFDNWQPNKNYKLAREKCGFEPKEGRSEGTYTNFASLDDRVDGFHYWFMFLKFGFCRATSDAAHEVREGIISREEAIKLIQKYDGEFPWEYFDYYLDYINITEDEFWEIAKKYVNEDIWKPIGNNKWKLMDDEVDKILEIPMEKNVITEIAEN